MTNLQSIKLRQLAESWRMTAARIENRPDAHKSPVMIRSLVVCLESRADVLVALRYQRGSEAQVRCLEEVGADVMAVIEKAADAMIAARENRKEGV